MEPNPDVMLYLCRISNIDAPLGLGIRVQESLSSASNHALIDQYKAVTDDSKTSLKCADV